MDGVRNAFGPGLELVHGHIGKTSLLGTPGVTLDGVDVQIDVAGGKSLFNIQNPQVSLGGFGFNFDGVVLSALEDWGSLLGGGSLAKVVGGAATGLGAP
jgi:hypothetical protein